MVLLDHELCQLLSAKGSRRWCETDEGMLVTGLITAGDRMPMSADFPGGAGVRNEFCRARGVALPNALRIPTATAPVVCWSAALTSCFVGGKMIAGCLRDGAAYS
eukprot:m.29538 g.29538  ORF g.29538 m.29538 type:complete len:105 (+) comp13743_c0_seq1:301-615(+)